jgi:Fic family protein
MTELETISLETFQAGHSEKGAGYSYFVPTKINKQWVWQDPVLNKLLEKAAVKLGELNSYARFVPNIDLFIQLHVTKEAVVSSRIEGTQTNMDEALMPEEEILPEKRNDWREVHNYTIAMNEALEALKTIPLSSRLLRNAHSVLLSNVRGEHKNPGEFRTSQNWIGGLGLNDAAFIPPSHHYVNELMGDLENFLHNKDIDVPELIRVGIAHYQFETIHPFLDGNGRIGRLLITLYLVSEGILEKPLLYLSVFFEKNKTLYYDNLTFVRTRNDLARWLKYFLLGVEQTATKAIATLTEVLKLKEHLDSMIQNEFGRRARNAQALLQHLYREPIITVEQARMHTNLSFKAANNLITSLQTLGILKEITGQSRNRIFVFEPYLKVFRVEV